MGLPGKRLAIDSKVFLRSNEHFPKKTMKALEIKDFTLNQTDLSGCV